MSDKRDAIPSEEILNKVSSALGLTDMESKYVLALGECEMKIDKVIYSSDDGIDFPEPPGEVIEPDNPEPVEPGEPDEPVEPDNPEPVEPGEPGEPDEPIQPPVPQPAPQPPAPVPDGDIVIVPWSHKKVIIALVVGLAGGLLIGCCSASTIIPIILGGAGF